ncbi:MAG: asparagine--tRNA ligase, partial [Alphaproteobacteria bacterium]|nr:asparagine--tRNA ligase [Alphaproteobacteria bacterium]
MKRIKIFELLKITTPIDKVLIKGWVKTKRDTKTFSFLEINDGSGLKNIQVIANDTLENYAEIKKLTVGSAVAIKGELVESKGGKQAMEIMAANVEIISIAPDTYPLQKKRHTDEFLRTIAHLRPRTNKFTAVFRVRGLIAYAIHKYFTEGGFVYIHTPIITSSDAEGAGEMFRVSTLDPEKLPKTKDGTVDYSKDFFGKSTNLTVSGQLAAENFSAALRNVYTFGPTFRAEKSKTRRHLTEFWMVEPEAAFFDLNDDMDLAESFLEYIVQTVLKEMKNELDILERDTSKLENVKKPLPRISYDEAIEILKKNNVELEWGKDIGGADETIISNHFERPVIVHRYP